VDAKIVSGDLILIKSDCTEINAGALPSGAGACCSEVLFNDTTTETTSALVQTLIGTKTFTVPADTLATNGSKLKVRGFLEARFVGF